MAYRTADIYLAACLRAAFNVLPDVRPQGAYCEFAFDEIDDAKARHVVESFYADTLKLPVKTFVQAWKDLRAMAADAKEAQAR